MKKAISLLLAMMMVLSLSACQNKEESAASSNGLAEKLTAHKWRYQHKAGFDGAVDFGVLGFRYDLTLEFRGDGTWEATLENSGKIGSAVTSSAHSLPGTWKLSGTELTVEAETAAHLKTTRVLQFDESMTDANAPETQKSLPAPDLSLFFDKTDGSDKQHWYVSDKYFYFVNFLFSAE